LFQNLLTHILISSLTKEIFM